MLYKIDKPIKFKDANFTSRGWRCMLDLHDGKVQELSDKKPIG
jgi:hypothetical protein